ncbi:hypothetical protein C2G38_2170126 [Gigaspora rosea]|uniref:Uncharacterized protein n=1 Tax=Gigaspora rosea TaxID=44941 RepID=A0A397VRC6_9GLOM|nr:hypothetical protein C2G38_2170126 [Gigaspora rosea]
MIELDDCKAESITANLKRFILAKLFNIEHLVHFGSNSASQDATEKNLELIKGVLLDKVANNTQVATLLADINQTFEIVTIVDL